MNQKECGVCKNIINIDLDASTTCTKCELTFCNCLHNTCFSEHCEVFNCKGSAMTILDPAWKVKLREDK